MSLLRAGVTSFLLFRFAKGEHERRARKARGEPVCPPGMKAATTPEGGLVCFEGGVLGRQFWEPPGDAWHRLDPGLKGRWEAACVPCRQGPCGTPTPEFPHTYPTGHCMHRDMEGDVIPSDARLLGIGPAAYRARRERFGPLERELSRRDAPGPSYASSDDTPAERAQLVEFLHRQQTVLARNAKRRGYDGQAVGFFEAAGDASANLAVPGPTGKGYRHDAARAYLAAAETVLEIMGQPRIQERPGLLPAMQERGALLAFKALQVAPERLGADQWTQEDARRWLVEFRAQGLAGSFDRAGRDACAVVGVAPLDWGTHGQRFMGPPAALAACGPPPQERQEPQESQRTGGGGLLVAALAAGAVALAAQG